MSQNPATEEVLESFEPHQLMQQEEILASLNSRFMNWRESLESRLLALVQVGENLQKKREDLARSISEEMGKVYRESLAEVDKSISAITFYTSQKSILSDRRIPTEMKRSFVHHQPLGIILGVMPWNFPVWQVIRFAVPALTAGNVVLLKPAPNVCRTTRILADCFSPTQGAFSWIRCPHDRIESLVSDFRVRGVSFTGSVATGSVIGSLAGKHVKKSVLELGGCDPALLFPDADLDRSLSACLSSRMANAGQSCVAAKRFVVLRSQLPEILHHLQDKMKRVTLGDPMDPATSMGPLARTDLRQRVHSLVQQTQAQGMVLYAGGQIPSGKGYFYPPTLLLNEKASSTRWDEEIFGPVVIVTAVESEEEMLAVANSTRFGLGASIYSGNEERSLAMAKKIQSGLVFVNGVVRSDARLPFGGVKDSGYGRELGEWGLLEFTNTQTIVVDHL